ncbi:ferric-rhodotorulic acid/ferric-coprogen receptor FhuE [Allopusillimonas soli]|uniref:Ferric-rhodotorulic acid/ferric-coprogen receptor FhuE n=2 Tax=Allopusillimonas soli TaxID=659016 RepID=A0A853F724_9BURK|nr:ferric-rhodotorulic acid/ferric-coprogen receptor FhuE [Allopusillimonas soli]TEA76255.1 ferric-rhodotorulic acid/ferric-coprogen receptor FhuE [Allopusillimonas soli]
MPFHNPAFADGFARLVMPRSAARQGRTSLFLSLIVVWATAGHTAAAHAQQNATSGNAAQQAGKVTMLPAITTTGTMGLGALVTEGTHSYTAQSTSAGTGMPLTLRDTPQSVTVITSQRMQDQNMQSLTDVMASTPGVSVQNYDSERYSFSSRGFSIDRYMYDGIPTAYDTGYSAGESSLDPIIYDRVEVVRGATGLLTGAGNPGASINLIRKHADSKEFAAKLTAGVGSWDNYRTTVDISSPLSRDGHVRGRLIAAYQQYNSYVDYYSMKKKVLYGTVDADLTPDTTLRVGFNYQDNDPRGSSWGGFPLWYADGTRTDWTRSKSVGADWTSWASTTTGAFADLEHRFGNDWTVNVLLNHSRHEADAKLLYLYNWPDAATGLGMAASPAWYLGDRTQNSVDVKASGPFEMFGRRHELVVGLSSSRQVSDFDYRAALNVPPVGNYLTWNGSYPEPNWSNAETSATYDATRQNGMYAAARLSLTDAIKLIVGGRYSRWETDAVGWAGGSPTSFSKNAFTPYAGLLYDLNDNLTAYVSYTSIFNPQSYQDRDGNWLDPLEGDSYEAGIKGEFLNGKLNASAALFQIEQDNLAQPDPGHMVPGTTNQAYYAAQGTKSRGYDLEVSGELRRGWQVAAGLSHWTAKDADGAPVQTNHPRTLLRLFTTYQFPGAWHRLTLGGGVNWQSKVYTVAAGPNGDEEVSQESYALVNLMARYRFNRHLSLQVNANNILDKKYYSQIGFYSQGAWGAPRNVMATLRYQY